MQCESLDKVQAQRLVEHMYSRKNIRKAILKELEETDGIDELIAQGVDLLNEFVAGSYYESKQLRVNQLAKLDFAELIMEILIVVVQIQQPVLYTNVVGQLVDILGLSNKGDGVKTIAEVLAVLAPLDVYDIIKEDRFDSLKLVCNFQMPLQLEAFIHQTKYLPPMICNPRIVKTNYDSGYLTKKECMILGTGNFHEGDICLDSINKFNQVPLSLDVELLKTYSEVPTCVLDDADKKAQWESMVRDSYKVYVDLVKQGNCFYLTHKPDKRGRTYAQGYHVSTQGNSFRKAIVDLYEKEIVEGI